MAEVRRYAEGTKVAVDKSRQEIEALMVKHGAQQYIAGFDEGRAFIGCHVYGRRVKFEVARPAAADLKKSRSHRTKDKVAQLLDDEWRRRWRAQLLIIKARFEIVGTGESTFDHEFAMYIVLPDGSTVAEHLLPRIEQAYLTGDMPPLLPEHNPQRKAET